MKTIGLGIAALPFNAVTLVASRPCGGLKAEIKTETRSVGVTSYTLEIVRNDEVSDPSMVIGSCENGTKRIVYQRSDG